MFEGKYLKKDLHLFDNQKSNIKGLIRKRRCILSDKCGGGKTLSVLYAFAYFKELNVMSNLLVMTPLSAYEKKVWKKDIQKFTKFKCIDIEDLYKIVCDAPQRLDRALSEFSIIYCKHSHIKHQDIRNLIGSLIKRNDVLFCVDEVHAFRNPKSALTLNLRDLTKDTKTFWGITATTISRNIENLYNIVNLVYPWFLGPWVLFRDTYCNTIIKTIGYDRFSRKKRQAIEAVSIKDPEGLRKKLEPLIITGESFVGVNYSYVDYELDEYEQQIYTKIAKGIDIDVEKDPEEWFKWVMSDNEVTKKEKSIGAVERYSSRFIYLQHAADGIVTNVGDITRTKSVKLDALVSLIGDIVAKKQSVLIYFEYLVVVSIVKDLLEKMYPEAVVLCSTGENRLKEGVLTEAACKQKSHIVLCSRAASESASYYFINNVVFFHIPTVPSTFVQMLGRITRKNTLFLGDLNCFIFRSRNIDLYKLLVVSSKTKLMEIASGEKELNVPDDYKEVLDKVDAQARYKKILLWKEL